MMQCARVCRSRLAVRAIAFTIVLGTSTPAAAQVLPFSPPPTDPIHGLPRSDVGADRLKADAPAGVNLVQNGDFAMGDPPSHWLMHATPTPAYLVWALSNGVFHFYRAPLAGIPTTAVVFQETGAPVPAGAPLSIGFKLGNTDNVRKRVTVLVHENDFSDLHAYFLAARGHAPNALRDAHAFDESVDQSRDLVLYGDDER